MKPDIIINDLDITARCFYNPVVRPCRGILYIVITQTNIHEIIKKGRGKI